MSAHFKGVPVGYMGVFSVANAPTKPPIGAMAYFSDALKGSETTSNGTGNLGFYDGNNWVRVDTGDPIGG